MKQSTFFLLSLFFSYLLSSTANAQTMTTFAGSGAGGFSGDGGPATAASMYAPWGFAIDAAGNIYFSDFTNKRVRKIDPAGIITTFAGNGGTYSGDGGPATAAGINGPTGLAVYGTDVYISENYSSRVRKVNAVGIITTFAGNGTAGYSGDGGPATDASISTPDGIGVDNAGNIYIPDQGTNYVRKVNTAGIITTIAGSGVAGYSGDGGPATLARLNLPDELAADAAGNIYFTDFNNNVVRKVNTAGIITTFAGTGVAGFGGDGGPATAAQLHGASGVHIDSSGNFYFCDSYNNRVRKINIASGIINTIAGTGTPGFSGDGGAPLLAEFNVPNLPWCNGDGQDVYIGDMNNNRIRRITYPVANTPPAFTGGPNQNLFLCEIRETPTTTSLDSILAINDPDVGQPESWNLVLAPLHGIAITAYSATSTGSAIIPAGLSYTTTTGFTGNDSFKVRITDGLSSDTVTIYISIILPPQAGTIIGPSTVCIGNTIALSNITGTGAGTWSSSNTNTSLSAPGVVRGISVGIDTVTYSVTNMCGTALTEQAIAVKNCNDEGIKTIAASPLIHLFPNPATAVLNVEWVNWEPANATIVIKDITGRLVFNTPIIGLGNSKGIMELTLPDLKEGVYLFTISSGSFYYNNKLVIYDK